MPMPPPQTSREQAEQLLKHGEGLLAEWKYPDPQLREWRATRCLR